MKHITSLCAILVLVLGPAVSLKAQASETTLTLEDIYKNGTITQLTKDGGERYVNGTFDWVYEEEFSCRDGFRWSSAWQLVPLPFRIHLV